MIVSILNELEKLDIGRTESFSVLSNKSKVYFFHKHEPSNNEQQMLAFAQKIATLGISLKAYSDAYFADDDESKKHEEEYQRRKEGVSPPMKRPRMDNDSL
ncbi:uncharacterized protein LOC116289331 [Actinia tenebrosa]|uniref:Uncharacterized protein LOC116289331 n=1 Tax=Actinia tenebrosa TaxID=6105 RepID=A0A6P8HHN9_ACTTE|nr:uncharacterized protein LOC116289331 [Actinia tenebrosa]